MAAPFLRRATMVVLTVCLAATAVFFLWQRSRRSEQLQADLHQADPHPIVHPRRSVLPLDSPQTAPSPNSGDDALLAGIGPPPPMNAAERIVASGFPPVSNPRSLAMRQVAGKSSEYLAAHMGDMLHAALVQEGESSFGSYSIASWATRFNENLFVLRLIEEGQTGPGEVVAAVNRQLDIELGRLEEFYSKYDNSDLARFRADTGGSKYDNEEAYHVQHGRYQGPVRELGRIVAVIYGCCVVLANLERMDNQQSLTRWLKVDNARGWGSAEFDVWLVDRCMRGPQFRDTALAKEWVAACDGAVISSDDKAKVSAWDAPWSKSQPLLGAIGVNTDGMRTVEVLKLPSKIPLDGVKMAVILGNFVESASLAAKAMEEGR